MPITLDFLDFVILVITLSNERECKCKTAKIHGDRHIKGAKRPGSERAREREGQGAKRPGSESSRERIGQGPIGRFAPGSELAREQKGSVPVLV